MGFHYDIFPDDISYGSEAGPKLNTAVIESDSGHEQRISRWSKAKHHYDVSKGVQTYADLSRLKAFWLARGGSANSFPYKDWLDCHSGEDGSYESVPGDEDQTLGVGDGSTVAFQLIKVYSSGLTTYTRKIALPVESSVRIWVAGTEKTAGSDFTFDLTTGVVTLATAPTVGQSVKASFRFYVPVRFQEDAERGLSVSADDFGHGSVPSIMLVEEFDPDPGYVGEAFFGGSHEVVISVDTVMSHALGRLWIVSATTTGKKVKLPTPTNIPTGGVHFVIINGGSNSFIVADHSGTTLRTLAAGEMALAFLTEDLSSTKVWYAG